MMSDDKKKMKSYAYPLGVLMQNTVANSTLSIQMQIHATGIQGPGNVLAKGMCCCRKQASTKPVLTTVVAVNAASTYPYGIQPIQTWMCW